MVLGNHFLSLANGFRPMGRTNEYAVAPDDRAGVSLADERCLPRHAFAAPCNRKVLLAGDAQSGRPAKLRPVFRPAFRSPYENDRKHDEQGNVDLQLLHGVLRRTLESNRFSYTFVVGSTANHGKHDIRHAKQVPAFRQSTSPQPASICRSAIGTGRSLCEPCPCPTCPEKLASGCSGRRSRSDRIRRG